jgi:metalloendopeptidase OMA1, mitochondrial
MEASVKRFLSTTGGNPTSHHLLSHFPVYQGMRRPKVPFFIPLLMILMTVVSCATVPHTGRRQLNFVSDTKLNSLALRAYQQILSQEKESTDARMSQIVERVAKRVTEAADSLDHPGFKWDVKLIDKDVPNAFCLPGGKIVVYSGIIPIMKNEAGLATVIAHEVAHAVARHGGERISQEMTLNGVVGLGEEVLKRQDGKLDSTSKIILGALGMGAAVGIMLPYSRTHEFEADHLGQLYMAKSGYDPTESVRLWERMAKINKSPAPVWLSTHPADEERIKRLNELSSDSMKLYQQAPVKYGLGSMF